MQIKCIRAFGNFRPGDVVEIPDGAVFDEGHFERLAASPEGGK